MKRFQCNKPERIYVDDFRYGLEEIIKQQNMDGTFNKFLQRHSKNKSNPLVNGEEDSDVLSERKP